MACGVVFGQPWTATLTGPEGMVWTGPAVLDPGALRFEGKSRVSLLRVVLEDGSTAVLLESGDTADAAQLLRLEGINDRNTLRVIVPALPVPTRGYAVREALSERWLSGEATVAVIGDSITAPVYTTGQGSVTHGLARAAGERLVGIQWPVNSVTPVGPFSPRDANYLNFYAFLSSGSFWSSGPFGRPGFDMTFGGDIAFMPMVGWQIGFSSPLQPGRELVSYILRPPFDDVGRSFWSGRDDVRVGLVWFNGSSTADAVFPFEMTAGEQVVAVSEWRPREGKPGLNFVEFALPAPASGEDLRSLRVMSPVETATEQNKDLVYALPMVYLDEGPGVRIWNMGIGGWGYREHSRNNPSQFPLESPGQYYTDEALEQFYAAAAASGHPVNTLVFALGANDSWAGTGDAPRLTKVAARRAIERHAEAARRHVADSELEVLLIAPYAVPNSTPSTQWSNADSILWSIATLGTGNALSHGETVRADQVSFVSLYTMMGYEEIDHYAPDWQEANGGVHPSPEGADGLAGLVQRALENPGVGDEPGTPPAVDLTYEVRVGSDGTPRVRLERLEYGTYEHPLTGEEIGVSGLGMEVEFHLVGVPRPPVDFDGDGVVGASELGIMLAAWGPCGEPCPADLNVDGEVGSEDLGILLSVWGSSGTR